MPRQKNFKKLVRSRMAKTGESYTSARAQFEPAVPAAPVAGGDPDAGALARSLAAAGFVNPITELPLTEPLLFGAGGGIGFAYLVFVYPDWTSINLEGRFNALYFEKRPFVEVACARLGLPLRVRPLSDPALADKYLREALANAQEVALTLDLAKLPGRTPAPAEPFIPRIVTVAGGDPDLTVLGLPRGRVTMAWSEVLDARWTMAKKYGGLYVLGKPTEIRGLRPALIEAMARTADSLLEPSRSNFDGNFGVPGIRKWARLLTDPRDKKGWAKLCPDSDSLGDALASVVRGLSGPGTSGGAARRLYGAFLDEAARLLGEPALATTAAAYRDLSDQWTALITLAGEPDVTPADLAEPLPDLADAEEAAAQSLRAAANALSNERLR
jgi:hypothetical protein